MTGVTVVLKMSWGYNNFDWLTVHKKANDISLDHVYNNRNQNTKIYDFQSHKLKTKH